MDSRIQTSDAVVHVKHMAGTASTTLSVANLRAGVFGTLTRAQAVEVARALLGAAGFQETRVPDIAGTFRIFDYET